MAAIESLLDQYDFKAACTYSLVEYKRVVLQNLSLCLRYLIEEDSYFLALNRVTNLSPHRPRQVATLVSLMSWVGMKAGEQEVEIGGKLEEILTLKSMSFIRTNIFFLWKKFEKSVDTLLNQTNCARAKEEPKKDDNGNVIIQIRESLCKTMECNNVNFFTEHLPLVRKVCDEIDRLEQAGQVVSQELKKLRDELRLAMTDKTRLYDYKNCLNVGDFWIHLESLAANIKDFATTNYKESQHLCPSMGLSMKKPY